GVVAEVMPVFAMDHDPRRRERWNGGLWLMTGSRRRAPVASASALWRSRPACRDRARYDARVSKARSQLAASDAFEAAEKIALLSFFRTLSQWAMYCAWSARGSGVMPRSPQRNAAPSSATSSSMA